MIRQVAETITRFGMFLPGERVGVAVSGGADSVALLHCLRELSGGLGISLAVVHLNHGLRGDEADADEQFVAGLAKRFDLRYFSRRVDVAAAARQAAENLEHTARRLRYQWFTELIQQGHSARIATGHTRSDQAETVLFRLLRGTGSAGLAGIWPVVEPGVVRPLLEVSRADVLAYLRQHDWTWHEDSTNRQTEFARNRIRHQLLPSLCRDWNPKLPEALAQLAQWAQAEEDYWSTIVNDLAERHIQPAEQGVELDVKAVMDLPEAAQRRLLRAALERVRGTLTGIDYRHVEALRRLTGDRQARGRLDLPGLQARRSCGRLRLWKPTAASDTDVPAGAVFLDAPGTFHLPGSDCTVQLELSGSQQTISGRDANEEGYNGKRQTTALDWERVPKPLTLRNWLPGDRYQPWGRRRPKKLKTLFQEGKIAAWDRNSWPVITAPRAEADAADSPFVSSAVAPSEVLVWVHQFGPAQQYAADQNSRTVLEITAFWSADTKNLEI